MNIILTSILISVLGALSVWAMGRRDPCGKPWLTVVCLAVLLLLPILTLLPKWHMDVLGQASSAGSVSDTIAWYLILWIGGSLLMAARIIFNHLSLSRWLRESTVLDGQSWQEVLLDSADMLESPSLPQLRMKSGLSSPVVAGIMKPVILMPEHACEWSDATRKMAILHELGHLHRRDLWVRYAADIACALHWYNPLVWWMRSTLLSQCEYACDARVIATGADPGAYVRALCDVVENAIGQPDAGSRPYGVCAMADHAPLKERVSRLMQGSRSGRPWLAVFAAIVTTGSALGLTLVRPVVKVPDNGTNEPASSYSQDEIDLRHSANPFPGN